jgi:hypothetical protein
MSTFVSFLKTLVRAGSQSLGCVAKDGFPQEDP